MKKWPCFHIRIWSLVTRIKLVPLIGNPAEDFSGDALEKIRHDVSN